MGFLKKLFGGDQKETTATYHHEETTTSYRQKVTVKRHVQRKAAAHGGYDELVYWIESRIGTLPPDDPASIPRLKELIIAEQERLSRPTVQLTIEHRDNNTLIKASTKQGPSMTWKRMRRKFKHLGCTWDRREQAWVAHGRLLTEADIWKPDTSGLQAYLRHIAYRQQLN